jgi:hypothetical protein
MNIQMQLPAEAECCEENFSDDIVFSGPLSPYALFILGIVSPDLAKPISLRTAVMTGLAILAGLAVMASERVMRVVTPVRFYSNKSN